MKWLARRPTLAGGAALILLALVGGGIAYALTGHPKAPIANPSTSNQTLRPSSVVTQSPGLITPTPFGSPTSTLVPAPSPRHGASMAYDARHKETVLFGGGNGTLADTWTWDGVRWTQKSPINSPSPRFNAPMTYDAARGAVVLFGGLTGPYLSLADTWTWDGSNWAQMPVDVSPPSLRTGSTSIMDYDASLGRVVLFEAGQDAAGASWVAVTWSWDGKTWTQLTPAQSPTFPNGTFFSMAYHPPTSRMVLLAYPSGTWAFDGSNWSHLAPLGGLPPERIEADLAYDARSKELILFGGPGLTDTWAWDGSAWRSLTPSTSPPRLWATGLGPSMAADPAGGVVLFGGALGAGPSNILWEWDGKNWHRVEATAYPSALDAGIAGAKAKTGLDYGTCSTRQCLTGSTIVGNTDPVTGLNAASVELSTGAQQCFAYVYRDSAGWHYWNAICPQKAGLNPVLGSPDTVRVSSGCANLRANPSLKAGIVDCLKDGTVVNVDSILPRYVDGHIWWSINSGKGWMAHAFLVTA